MDIFLQLTGEQSPVSDEVKNSYVSGRHLSGGRFLVDGQDDTGWHLYQRSYPTCPEAEGQRCISVSGMYFLHELHFLAEADEDEFEPQKLDCVYNKIPSEGRNVSFTILGVDPVSDKIAREVDDSLDLVQIQTRIRKTAHVQLVGLGKQLGQPLPLMLRNAVYDYLLKYGVDPRALLPEIDEGQEEVAATSRNNAATATDEDEADDHSFSLAP